MDDRRLAEEMQKYPNVKEIVWCQEEPLNQGAWYAKQHTLSKVLKKGQTLHVAARPASSSPAVGYGAKHVIQQKEVVEEALGKLTQ
jgi:2-oxoglutarate dehydrogenase E1 component